MYMYVALRKESVDRNTSSATPHLKTSLSLSARRAWIEMTKVPLGWWEIDTVALRKESVDRNDPVLHLLFGAVWSLSARRAWIEIRDPRTGSNRDRSLSARRAWIEIS